MRLGRHIGACLIGDNVAHAVRIFSQALSDEFTRGRGVIGRIPGAIGPAADGAVAKFSSSKKHNKPNAELTSGVSES